MQTTTFNQLENLRWLSVSSAQWTGIRKTLRERRTGRHGVLQFLGVAKEVRHDLVTEQQFSKFKKFKKSRADNYQL